MRYSLAPQSKPWIDSMGRDANARRVAYSGAQALVIVRVWRPDVAILDDDMDGVRGVELASGIRKTVPGPSPSARSGLGLPPWAAPWRSGSSSRP